MLGEVIIFAFSLALVIKGTEIFVDCIEQVSKLLKISEAVMGLTFVAVGTSIPELATAIMSAMTGNTAIAAGTVIGSNIANIGLILSVSFLMAALKIKRKEFYKDAVYLLAASILFLVFAFDKVISVGEGFALLCLFIIYLYLLVKRHETDKNSWRVMAHLYQPHKIRALFEKKKHQSTYIQHNEKYDVARKILEAVFGLVVLFIGAKYLVSSTAALAALAGISEEIIAMSLIAVGTSIPELSVSLVAVKKKLVNLLMGNIIGSCIANILLVAALSAMIKATVISTFDVYFSIPLMMVLIILLVRYMKVQWLSRITMGLIFLAAYVIFIAALAIFYVI